MVRWQEKNNSDHGLKKSYKNLPLDRLKSLGVSFVGMVETNLELIDLTLKGFLDAEGLALSLLLGLKRSRH